MSNSKFHGLNINNILLIIADFSVISLSFILSVLLAKSFFNIDYFNYESIEVYISFLTFTLPLHIILLSVGLYNEKLRESLNGILVRIVVSAVATYIFTKFVEELFNSVFYPPVFIECLFFISLTLLTICRIIIIKFGLNEISKNNILILGAGKRASVVEKYLRRKSDRVGLKIVGYVALEQEQQIRVKKGKVFKLTVPLENFAIAHDIDEIVIATNSQKSSIPLNDLLKLKQAGIKMIDVIDFVERETGQIAVDQLNPYWFLYQDTISKSKFSQFCYWLFNTSIALLIGISSAPIMLLTILLIKIEGGWRFPILYSQERIGLDGNPFNIYKFTSMRTDAEKNGAQWAQKNDPRVTKVGRIIRKFRIDEFPQLYNVIVGDMCFVGPRPERPQFTQGFNNSIPYYNQRHNVKPGLTGWAQLKYPYGSNEKDALEKLKFDLYYIRNRNFTLDILILLKTSEIILFGKGR